MMNWYIFSVFIALVWLAWRMLSREKIPRLRVLMYHKISGNGDSDGLTVPVNILEAQFNYLLKQGYSPLLFSDLLNYTRLRKPLPRRPVLITFDDGYRDNYTIMYPLLKKYGMKANIFLVPAFLQPQQVRDHKN